MTGSTSGTPRSLLDTNILVYAYDRSEPEKQKQAAALLHRLALERRTAVTSQVLAEFFVCVTRKIRVPLTPGQALEQLESHSRTWEVLDVSTDVVLHAARASVAHSMHFYDAQIWATAKLHGIPIIISEDFASGTTLEGVRFVNPFTLPRSRGSST